MLFQLFIKFKSALEQSREEALFLYLRPFVGTDTREICRRSQHEDYEKHPGAKPIIRGYTA